MDIKVVITAIVRFAAGIGRVVTAICILILALKGHTRLPFDR